MSEETEGHVIGQPVLRQWELNENSTRYDYLVAAPSDETLVKMWIAIGTTSAVVAIFVTFVMASILLSKKCRSQSFNLYLVALMIPDNTFSFFCSIACFLSVAAGHWVSPSMCRFQSWFATFGVAGNSWMTVAIVKELHKMLRSARRCIRYTAPTSMSVAKQAAVVLLYSAFCGCIAIVPTKWNIPVRTEAQQGYACVPLEYNVGSSVFYFLVFLPMINLLPLMYVTYVLYDIWKKSLLPKRGQRKVFTLYMLRIVLVMYAWWLPSILFLFMAPRILNPWGKVFFSLWMHLQGIASSSMLLPKPDIQTAAKRLLTCKCTTPEPKESNKRSGRRGSSSGNRSSIDFGFGTRMGSILGSVRALGSRRNSQHLSERRSCVPTQASSVAMISSSSGLNKVEEEEDGGERLMNDKDVEGNEAFDDNGDEDEGYGFDNEEEDEEDDEEEHAAETSSP